MNGCDVLRRAATQMRQQHGPDHVRHLFWRAVARWLEDVAAVAEDEERVARKWPEGSYSPSVPGLEPAIKVALTYLGENA